MRISPISITTNHYGIKNVTLPAVNSKSNNINFSNSNNITFNGIKGRVIGGAIGASLAGLGTIIALANPVGLVAAATLAAAEVGGAIVGGKVGDIIENEEDI